MRIAIDARVPRGFAGGVAQVITGLAQGFACADSADLERLWIVYPDYEEWLAPSLPGGDRVLVAMGTVERLGMAAARHFPRAVSAVRPHAERLINTVHSSWRDSVPLDSQLRGAGVDVVHLPFQDGINTGLPNVYQPHDFQHRYLPQLFSNAQRHHRETVWRDRAVRASVVTVATRAVAEDAVRFWRIPREKIHVVPLAPIAPTSVVGVNGGARQNERPLILYPAAFWPHKGHSTLVQAVGELRRSGLEVELCLPGAPVGVFEQVRRQVISEGLDPRSTLPGYVSDVQLDRLYRKAFVVAVPSLFEAASFPVWEAFARGIPVVAARTTSLPAQVADGGLIFPPGDAVGLAAAIRSFVEDDVLWAECAQAGRRRVAEFSWETTSLAYTAIYRLLAGQPPTDREFRALHRSSRF